MNIKINPQEKTNIRTRYKPKKITDFRTVLRQDMSSDPQANNNVQKKISFFEKTNQQIVSDHPINTKRHNINSEATVPRASVRNKINIFEKKQMPNWFSAY